MDEADINRYLKNALDQVNAQHEEHLKEQPKELRLEEKLTKKFNDHLGCTLLSSPRDGARSRQSDPVRRHNTRAAHSCSLYVTVFPPESRLSGS